jgi:hypothetical protein
MASCGLARALLELSAQDSDVNGMAGEHVDQFLHWPGGEVTVSGAEQHQFANPELVVEAQ